MFRLNCFTRSLVAVLFCASASLACAEPRLQSAEEQLTALKQEATQAGEAPKAKLPRMIFLEEEVVQLSVTLPTEVAREEKIHVADASAISPQSTAPIAKMDTIVVTASKISPELVTEETFTAKNSAAGWSAWKRQSAEYKKAHPWEKILVDNCAREPKICKRTALKGTPFYLPAPEIRVLVSAGTTVPDAIALVPTATPGVLALDLKTPPVTAHEKELLVAEVAVLRGELAKSDKAFKYFVIVFIVFGVLLVFLLLQWVIRPSPHDHSAVDS